MIGARIVDRREHTRGAWANVQKTAHRKATVMERGGVVVGGCNSGHKKGVSLGPCWLDL
jgi:hypothetical protein